MAAIVLVTLAASTAVAQNPEIKQQIQQSVAAKTSNALPTIPGRSSKPSA